MANFIGHTRYSLWKPGNASWKASAGNVFRSESEYRDYLFSEERLSLRASIFIESSLPQLAAGSVNHNYHHVVSYSDLLPLKHQELLEAAAEKYDFLVLDRHTNHSLDLAQFAAEKFGRGSVYGQFKLDDDDVLSVKYFDHMSRYLSSSFVGMQVSFALGFTGIMHESSISRLSQSYYPMINLGLLGVNQINGDGSLLGPAWVAHTRSDRSNPVILDSTAPLYFRALHATNDRSVDGPESLSAARKEVARLPQVDESGREDFAAHFPFLISNMPRMSKSVLFQGSQSVVDETLIEFDVPRRNFRVGAEFTYGVHNSKVVSLMRFDLMDANGKALAATEDIDAYGLSRSSDPRAGFFRYIRSSPGSVSLTGSVELPPGIYCKSVAIVRWGKNSDEVDITLNRFEVYG